MAPVPKKKHTRSRSNMRRNSPAKRRATLPVLTRCPSCKKLKEPHKLCPHCGSY